METAVLSVLDCLLVKADEKLVLFDYSVRPQRNAWHVRSFHSSEEIRGDLWSLRRWSWVVCILLRWSLSVCYCWWHCVCSKPLVYGVPQGSVMGPVLFTLYSQPLLDVILTYGCDLPMILRIHKAHHLVNFILCRQAFRHLLKTSYHGWTAISS